MYERMREEVRASHILVKGQDSAAYARALALRDSIVRGGRSFEEMARLYSEDPAAPETGATWDIFRLLTWWRLLRMPPTIPLSVRSVCPFGPVLAITLSTSRNGDPIPVPVKPPIFWFGGAYLCR